MNLELYFKQKSFLHIFSWKIAEMTLSPLNFQYVNDFCLNFIWNYHFLTKVKVGHLTLKNLKFFSNQLFYCIFVKFLLAVDLDQLWPHGQICWGSESPQRNLLCLVLAKITYQNFSLLDCFFPQSTLYPWTFYKIITYKKYL